MKIATRDVVFSWGITPPPGEENRTVQAGDVFADDDPLVLKRPDLFAELERD